MRSNRPTIETTESALADKLPAVAFTIAYHPNVERVGQRAIVTDAPHGTMVLSRDEPLFFAPGASTSDPVAGEPLDHDHISRTPIHVTKFVDGSVRIDFSQSRTKVIVSDQLVTGTITFSAQDIDRGVVLLLGNRVVLVLHRTQQVGRVLGHEAAGELIGESDGMCRVLWDIKSVADLEKHVLIRGETGTGKELVAAAIHRLSKRSKKDFVAVNLPAIPPSLAAAELFGAEKGTFTGSINRYVGYFEKADDGTLFLDEIGDAPHELQLPLFRALELGEIQTLNSSHKRTTNARVIAATDANLESKVAEGSFRAALLNRLATYEIWIPALRERREDIGRLLVSFLRRELEDIGEAQRFEPPKGEEKPWLPAALVASLIDCDWPGNVRQLKNAVRQLVIGNRGRPEAQKTLAIDRILRGRNVQTYVTSSPDGTVHEGLPEKTTAPLIEADALHDNLSQDDEDDASSSNQGPSPVPRRKPADIAEDELREALHECRWEPLATADRLGIARGSLYTLRDRFPWFRTAGLLTSAEIDEAIIACNGDLKSMAEKLQVSESGLRRRVRELRLTGKMRK